MLRLFADLFGAGRSPADDLIKWLADKSLDDRRIVAGLLFGGPESDRVYAWVTSRPDCDRGTASMVFWNMLNPEYCILARAEGRQPESVCGYSTMMAIMDRWRRDEFQPAVFEWKTSEHVRLYKRLMKKHCNGTDPLCMPESLMAPVRGRQAIASPAVAHRDDTELTRLLDALRSTHQGFHTKFWDLT